MPKKVYNLLDFTSSESLNIVDTFIWSISGVLYEGKVSDVVEFLGIDRMYAVPCDKCGKQVNILGSSIINNGFVCKACRTAKRARILEVKKEEKAKRSLLELVPDTGEYWSIKNNVSPEEVFENKSSLTRYWLNCKFCGIEFSKAYVSILSSGCTCRSCSSKYNIPIEKSLYYLYPELAERFDCCDNIVTSQQVSAYSNIRYKFKCSKCGCVFESSPHSIIRSYTGGSTGCDVCAGLRVVKGINDLSGKNLIAFKYWDYDRNTERSFFIMFTCFREV